jgi:hypothetical protein
VGAGHRGQHCRSQDGILFWDRGKSEKSRRRSASVRGWGPHATTPVGGSRPSGPVAAYIRQGNQLKKFAMSMAFAAAVIGFAPTAAAESFVADPNGPDGVVAGFLQGLASAFGSSSSSPQSRPQSYIYPDFQSCNREAVRLRQPGVTAECNPVGGASGQYQLIYIPRR